MKYLESIWIEEVFFSMLGPEASSSPWSRLCCSNQTDGEQKPSCRHRHKPREEEDCVARIILKSYTTIFC